MQRAGPEPRVQVSASPAVRSGGDPSSRGTSAKREDPFRASTPPAWEEEQMIMAKCSVHVGDFCPHACMTGEQRKQARAASALTDGRDLQAGPRKPVTGQGIGRIFGLWL